MIGNVKGMPMMQSLKSIRAVLGIACWSFLAPLPTVCRAENKPGVLPAAAKANANSATACIACHGAKGEGNAQAGFPRLGGLDPGYIQTQLENFAANKRSNPVMSPIAMQLTAAQRSAAAAYFGAMPRPTGVSIVVPEQLKMSDTGAWLANRGRWDDNLPACVQCHGQGGSGVGAAFPSLVGQSRGYLIAQLLAFKNGSRPGGPMNLMGVVAKKLSDTDIPAVAVYFGLSEAAADSATKQMEKK